MVTKRSPKARSRARSKPLSRSLRVYQKVAIIFVIVSLLLLLGVLYLSIAEATVRVTPTPEVVSTTVVVDVTSNPNTQGQVTGYVFEQTFEKAKDFAVPQDGGSPVEAKAHGTVTMINETGTQADLVATTRLLSEEGVLFRLDSAVSIPANGQIEAAVSADQPGLSGEIGPTQFTIPGLSANLQASIYAVSVDPMVGGVEYVRVVTQADLDQAAEELAQEILEEAKPLLRGTIRTDTFDGEEYTVTILEKTSDTEPGAQTGSFTISEKVHVTAVFYDRELIVGHAQSELYARIPDGYELREANVEGLVIDVTKVDAAAQTASLTISLDGTAVLSTNSDVLDTQRFLGKTPAEVESLLESSPGIEDVHISFTPFWLKRIPTLQDHIRVIVE